MKKLEPSSPIKVLVVDDEETIVELLSLIMKALGGIATLKAFDGNEALEVYHQEKPDIVFSDIYMPKLNGLMLLKRLRELNNEIPIILFTGYQHFKQMISSSGVKPNDFLEKPLNPQKVIEIMYYYFPQLRKR